jgi:dienelactone hydrolase
MLTIMTALERAARVSGKDGQQFAAHAPFYPLCYLFEYFATGKTKSTIMAPEEFRRYTGAPVRIFAGGKDDYDSQDPEACQKFVNIVDQPARAAFSIRLYPGATHGWDQDQSAQFYEKMACKGTGCRNLNSPDRAIAAQSVAELVEFMKQSLSPK